MRKFPFSLRVRLGRKGKEKASVIEGRIIGAQPKVRVVGMEVGRVDIGKVKKDLSPLLPGFGHSTSLKGGENRV